jgi:5-formyltetrahydrofolate cyclo-ligase
MTDRLPQICRICPQMALRAPAAECPASPSRKGLIRRAVMTSLGSMSPEVRRQKSLAIARRIQAHDLFHSARMIMVYAAMELEVDLWSLVLEAWRLGKRVSMPRIVPPLDEPRIARVHDRRILPYEVAPADVEEAADHPGLQMDIMGIWEPKPASRPVALAEVDLLLVPCTAYDRRGMRMGKGGGFYDRLLSSDGLRAAIAGVAFSEQIFASLPHCPHDRAVQMIFCESALLEMPSDKRSQPNTIV